jgi:hypothetical protein
MSNTFDRLKLRLLPLSERENKISLKNIKELDPLGSPDSVSHQTLSDISFLAQRIAFRHRAGGKTVLMMGAHPLRRGNSRYFIDLMRRGLVDHVATNMAVAIHDFELAYIGATLEDVEYYVQDGRFGNWKETGRLLNTAINDGARKNIGMGQAVGEMIHNADIACIPHKEISIFNAAYELGIPITVHKSIGYDIIDQHPLANYGAMGKTSGDDFLKFCAAINNLENGAFINMGSSVMGPEVYLKALSMARNVAHQSGREIKNFTTAVFDIVPLGDWRDESVVDYRKPGVMSDPRYYFRPLKSILVRTVKDGGESFYIQGDFSDTVPLFYRAILENI